MITIFFSKGQRGSKVKTAVAAYTVLDGNPSVMCDKIKKKTKQFRRIAITRF